MKNKTEFIKNGILLLGALIFTLFLLEVIFRVLLSLGWVSTAAETYNGNPYGFYLWSREGGHPHGINNRYGFSDHDYGPESQSEKKVIIIGDSFVEALQVDIANKMGPLLQSSLNSANTQKYSVMSFGRSGEYPAHYLERYKVLTPIFSPDITFVLIYMGNDFRNASPSIESRTSGVSAERYMFYQVASKTKDVTLDPKSLSLVEDYRLGTANNIKHSAPRQQSIKQKFQEIFLNHFFLYSEIPYRLNQLLEKSAALGKPNEQEKKDIGENILKNKCDTETIFINSYKDCWIESNLIMSYLFREFKKFEDASKSKVYFIGIPANESFWGDAAIEQVVNSHGGSIPIENYGQYLAKKYSTDIADVDLERPNKMLKKIMEDQGLPYLDLHEIFYKELVQNKRQVFCRWVDGHLCEDGHQIVAEEIKRIINETKQR